MPSLVITDEEFRELPEAMQRELLSRFAPDLVSIEEEDEDEFGDPTAVAALADDGTGDDDEEGPPDLSPAQARKANAAFSARTKSVIRQIVSFPEDGFRLLQLEKKMKAEPGGLKGSWTGITKVTRRILGDDDAMLIAWTALDDGDHHGRLSPMTYRSFRKVLGIS